MSKSFTDEELKVFFKIYKTVFEKGCPKDYGFKYESECISRSCHGCKIDSIKYYLSEEVDYSFVEKYKWVAPTFWRHCVYSTFLYVHT